MPFTFILIARTFRNVHVVQRFVSEFLSILLGKAQMHIRPGLEVINPFPCSTQLSTKLILLLNVKMPTIVGILTFISMIYTTSERLEARNFFIFRYFSFYEQLKFRAGLK